MKKMIFTVLMAITSLCSGAQITADSVLFYAACEQMRPPLLYLDRYFYKTNDTIRSLNISERVTVNQKYDVLYLLEEFPLEVIDGFKFYLWNRKGELVICDNDGYCPDTYPEFTKDKWETVSKWDKDRFEYPDYEYRRAPIHDGCVYIASKIIVKNRKIIDIDTVKFRFLRLKCYEWYSR